MINFFSYFLTDMILLSGILLLILGFLHRFREHRFKMMAAGVILLVIGVAYLDMAALAEAFESGRQAAMER